MAEPCAKLRPGVRLFPGGHVILLPTQIMAIMELAEMAHCRHQCSARVICQVGSDMPEKQTGKQAESLKCSWSGKMVENLSFSFQNS